MIKNVFLLAALSLCLFQSCDNDDNEPVPGYVSAETKAAFDEKYPAAKDVEWETRNAYLIVHLFWKIWKNTRKNHWFRQLMRFADGIMNDMTETDIPFAQLPDAVKTAFQQGEYSTWKVDDVDMIERRDVETVYVIETEQGNSEVDLYYSPDGILVKTVLDAGGNDGYEDFIPSQPSSSVDAYVKEHYPSARILDIDREKGVTEVEILDGTVCRELLFDDGGAWMQTKTELRITALPDAVMAAIKASQYATYRIDDADFIETLTGEWYLVELESGKQEVKLRIDATGKIL